MRFSSSGFDVCEKQNSGKIECLKVSRKLTAEICPELRRAPDQAVLDQVCKYFSPGTGSVAEAVRKYDAETDGPSRGDDRVGRESLFQMGGAPKGMLPGLLDGTRGRFAAFPIVVRGQDLKADLPSSLVVRWLELRQVELEFENLEDAALPAGISVAGLSPQGADEHCNVRSPSC